MKVQEFRELTSQELQSLPMDRTIFVYACGLLEDHGPHLPLDLDVQIARLKRQTLAHWLSQSRPDLRVILLPEVPFGTDGNTSKISLSVRPYVLRDWLVDSTRGLEKLGARHFLVVSGTLSPRHLTAIEDAGKILRTRPLWKGGGLFRKRTTWLGSVDSTPDLSQGFNRSLFFPSPTEHGGELDSSYALKLQILRPPFPELHEHTPQFFEWYRGETQGFWGEPSKASLEVAEAHLKRWVETVGPKALAVLDGASSEKLFRSWYSIVPMNLSTWRVWVLSLLLALVLGVWLFWNFQTMIADF
jgi:hypothetical protein